ncbi:hypothetical protein PTKIN_Ptkin09bG0084800 [Pterospermum kingtungense]
MAAEIETHHSFCSNNKNNNICSSFHHLCEELSTILNHGSISFGRYAGNSSAWEKRSVFTHNRCQEELEKFKAPGLVAQKKAYFEKYYKFVRSMKALAADQQKTSRFDSSQETWGNTTLQGNGIDAAVAKREKKLSNASQIQNSDDTKSIHLNSNNLKPSCKEVESCSSGSNEATMKGVTDVPTDIVEVGNSFEKASVLYSPLLDENSKSAKQNAIASSKVRQSINKLRKHGTVLKNKGTLSSATNKAKVCSITTSDAGMKSKLNLSFHQQAHVKSISKTITRPDGLRNMAHDRRKPSELSSHHMRPGFEKSSDQRPKLIFRSLLAREISNHNIGVEEIRNCNKELKQKEGKDKIHAGLGKDAKHASTLLSCTDRPSVQKLSCKVIHSCF